MNDAPERAAMKMRGVATVDIDAIVAMLERRRIEYQAYQPTLWRKSATSAPLTRAHFLDLMNRPGIVFVVAESGGHVAGFLIATEVPTPPVYDPGGRTYVVDDFCVAEAAVWPTIGAALLAEGSRLARAAGAVQVVVVCGDRDEPKAALLRQAGLTIASNWWTRPL